MLWYEEIVIDITEDGITEAKLVLGLIKEYVDRHTDVTYFIPKSGMVISAGYFAQVVHVKV